jgi:hypothetical protein
MDRQTELAVVFDVLINGEKVAGCFYRTPKKHQPMTVCLYRKDGVWIFVAFSEMSVRYQVYLTESSARQCFSLSKSKLKMLRGREG